MTGDRRAVDGGGPRAQRLDARQLDRVRVAVRNVLNLQVGPTVSMSADVEWHAEQMALEVAAKVLAESLPPEQVVTSKTFKCVHPDGWWQMWLYEHRSWPVVRSWLRRRPVRMHTETRTAEVTTDLHRYRAYPQANVPLPEEEWGRPVMVTVTESLFRWADDPAVESTGG